MLELINNLTEGTIGLAEKGAATAADYAWTLLPLAAGRPVSDGHAGLLLLFGPELDDPGAEPLHGDARLEQAKTWIASRLGGQRLVDTSRSALR